MTIYINKNQSNICAFTLNENTNEFASYYILELESKVDYMTKLMLLKTDMSINRIRYNKYLIQEVELINEDLMNQKINLTDSEYNYRVWESSTNVLDINLFDNIIESGLVKVNLI